MIPIILSHYQLRKIISDILIININLILCQIKKLNDNAKRIHMLNEVTNYSFFKRSQ